MALGAGLLVAGLRWDGDGGDAMRTITITLYKIYELDAHAQAVAYTNYREESGMFAETLDYDNWLNCVADNGDEFTEDGTRY